MSWHSSMRLWMPSSRVRMDMVESDSLPRFSPIIVAMGAKRRGGRSWDRVPGKIRPPWLSRRRCSSQRISGLSIRTWRKM